MYAVVKDLSNTLYDLQMNNELVGKSSSKLLQILGKKFDIKNGGIILNDSIWKSVYFFIENGELRVTVEVCGDKNKSLVKSSIYKAKEEKLVSNFSAIFEK